MFKIRVKTQFSASHQLTLPDGRKEPQHSHNWKVTAELSRKQLSREGFVMDFKKVQELLGRITAKFADNSLEKLDYFKQNNSSAELVSKYIYENLQGELPEEVKLEYIAVEEETGCWGQYCD